MVKKKEKKRKKKNRPKGESKSTIQPREENKFFVKANGTDGAPRWRPDF